MSDEKTIPNWRVAVSCVIGHTAESAVELPKFMSNM
jgi:hypothetical protein